MIVVLPDPDLPTKANTSLIPSQPTPILEQHPLKSNAVRNNLGNENAVLPCQERKAGLLKKGSGRKMPKGTRAKKNHTKPF